MDVRDLDVGVLVPGGPVAPRVVWRWASVTAASPLEVLLDGDVDPVPVVDCLADPASVTVGGRVYVQQVGRRLVVLGAAPAAGGGWQPVTFAAGWADYGGTFQACQRRMVGDVVQLRGLARCAAGAGAESTMFTLPAGWRPPADVVAATVGSAVSGTSGAASTGTAHTHPIVVPTWFASRLSIYASGVVAVNLPTEAGGVHSLDGVWFSVTP